QFDPEPVYATLTAVAAGEADTYRNLEPKSMLEETKRLIDAPWSKKIRDGLGTRPASLQKSYEMKPETPASEASSRGTTPWMLSRRESKTRDRRITCSERGWHSIENLLIS